MGEGEGCSLWVVLLGAALGLCAWLPSFCLSRHCALAWPWLQKLLLNNFSNNVCVLLPAGAILFEETLFQSTRGGKKMVDCLNEQGILPGIKVDKGLHPLANSNGESW